MCPRVLLLLVPVAVPALAARVLEGDPSSAWALVKIGPAAREAIPALVEARWRYDHLKTPAGKALRSIRRE